MHAFRLSETMTAECWRRSRDRYCTVSARKILKGARSKPGPVHRNVKTAQGKWHSREVEQRGKKYRFAGKLRAGDRDLSLGDGKRQPRSSTDASSNFRFASERARVYLLIIWQAAAGTFVSFNRSKLFPRVRSRPSNAEVRKVRVEFQQVRSRLSHKHREKRRVDNKYFLSRC